METEDLPLTGGLSAPSHYPALAERDLALREFELVLSSSVPSHSGCLSIEGGWGTGRTSLLNAACLIAEANGCMVLRARGGALERAARCGALLRVIEGVASLRNPDPEVVEHIEHVVATITRGSEPNFSELGAAFYALLLSVRRLGPVLIAIDDAELIDDASTAALEYVFNRIDDQQIWLVTATSNRLPGAAPRPIEHLLVTPHARHFQVGPLSADGVRSILVRELDRQPDDEFVTAVHAATAGRPHFVVALAKACREANLIPSANATGSLERLSYSRVAQQVLVRLDQHPMASRVLLEACAVFGDGLDVAMAHQISGVDSEQMELAVEVLVQAELLQTDRPLAVTAPIVRWAVVGDMSAARQSQLHLRCATLLEQYGANDAVIVRHLLATELSWNRELAERLSVTGRQLMESGETQLAVQCLRRSLNESPTSVQDPSLWLDLARGEVRLGLRTSLSSFQRAINLGVLDDQRCIEVALGLMRILHDWPELHEEGVCTLRAVESQLVNVDAESKLEFELGLTVLAGDAKSWHDSATRIEALVDQSDQNARFARVARAFLDVRSFESGANATASNIAAALTPVLNSERMLVGNVASDAIQARACRLLLIGDEYTRVDLFLEMSRWRANSLGDRYAEDEILRLALLSKLWQGALDEAEGAYRRHLELGQVFSTRPVVGVAELLGALGRSDEALQTFGGCELDRLEDPLDLACGHVERGSLFAGVGRAEEALDEYVRASEVATSAGLDNEIVVGWRPAMATTLASLGRWDEAHRVAEQHLANSRQFEGRRVLGVALRTMAASSLDYLERFSWLTEAVKVLEGSPAKIDLGAMLVDRRDVEGARDLLQRGAALASSCRAEGLVATAGVHLRAAGARPRRLGSSGVDSLTPAELRAVHLAAAHVTNRAIADELFVNVKTIEGHLSRAYRKLGVTSRFELAKVLKAQANLPRESVDESMQWRSGHDTHAE